MKKLFIFLLSVLTLCGCSQTKEISGDDCDFLIDANWEGNDTQCINVINFKEDFGFSNWCYCGSPVGDGDLAEEFRYRASDRAILLLDGDSKIMETGKILYVDDMYLIVNLWNRCYVYENIDIERPTVRTCALQYTGTEEMSKPCLSILDYENGILTVSSYNYDGDAAENFEIWELPVSEDITFSTVNVTVDGENETIETSQLTENDCENIGEFYHSGYVEMNYEGEAASVVFYGELIISH